MKILYIGSNEKSSTSFHRAKALVRIGNQVDIVNPYEVYKNLNFLTSKFHYRTGFRFLQKNIYNWVKTNISNDNYDLVWVNGGELLGLDCVSYIKSKIKKPIILYNNDDPTGGRDGRRFDMLIDAIPNYDICVVMRELNVEEYLEKGAKKVIRVFMSYDEIAHSPLKESEIHESFKSEVSFIGTNMPKENRDKFLFELIKREVPISIWGGRWERSPYWKDLKPFFRGHTLKGEDYIAAIQGSKICLGLLSKGNRDLHTTRTFEIPFIGSLFCAERTKEHKNLFEENREAVFWQDVDECAEKCHNLLVNTKLIEEIARNGRHRLLSDKRGNEDVVKYILNQIS